MADKKKYEVGSVATQTEAVVIGPDGNAVSSVEVLAHLMNRVDEIHAAIVGKK